ncbi:NADH-quinone oxidoreductase subunit C [Sphingomonas sp.]|uniref:NADH-quinone oxidoreductase subunit C n=1 Tax=Sphingomonas sp. TaxID=28214 RepID=UPI0025D2ADA5|nr:NADH-quinone oxidoreductase subunit C [Sphingomonas sp.]
MKTAAPRMIDRDDAVWAPLLGDGVSRRPGVEVAFNVSRARLIEVIDRLRVEFEYQQLMEIAGADYPERAERFEVVYCLLSLTKNHRIRVHVSTDEVQPVPSVTAIWPVAGWLEREVYDMYGVLFEGNTDLRRILTDYGFVGHPLRKDFPQTGYVELRYSEEAKRVVYEPVKLAQDFRSFDFLSPWEGAAYVLPGDEKAAPAAPPPAPQPEAKGAPTPLKADEIAKSVPAAKPAKAKVTKPKTSDSTAKTGAGKPGPDDGPKPRKPRVKKAPAKDSGGEA